MGSAAHRGHRHTQWRYLRDSERNQSSTGPGRETRTGNCTSAAAVNKIDFSKA
jgi:hypothetical protein